MGNQVLETRLGVLLRSAAEVESVVTALETSRQAVKDTNDSIGAAVLTASGLPQFDKLLEALGQLLERLPEDDRLGRAALKQAVERLGQLNVSIPELVKTLTQVQDELGGLVRRHVDFGDGWNWPVSDTTSGLKSTIAKLTDKVRADETPLPALWDEYSTDVFPAAEGLFSEYIDLLAGVSIRERGLAISALDEVCHLDELCRMADWHVSAELRQRVDWAQPTLTVPGGSVKGNVYWPIMRLRFAYWSIWGMPLEANEFGKVVVGQYFDRIAPSQDEIAAFGERGLRLLVADVIAAWAEGPAYACALYFLDLDPRDCVGDPAGGHVTAAERSYLVETCLREQIVPKGAEADQLTPESADLGYGYLDFVSDIADRWRDTLKAAGAREMTEPRRRLLAALPARVRSVFDLKRPFGLEDWRIAKTIWPDVEAGTKPPENLGVGIRHLMNSAWYARFSDEVHPRPSVDDIDKKTLQAGQEIVDPAGARSRVLRGGGAGSGSDQLRNASLGLGGQA